MKNKKRAAALMTAGFLSLSLGSTLGMTAFASSITISKGEAGDATHAYKAYAIITGKLATDGKTLSDLEWGADVNSTNLIAALKANKTALGITLGDTPTIDDIADALATITDGDKLELLAKVIGDDPDDGNAANNILSSTGGKALTQNSTTKNYETGEIDDGWYLIKDSLKPATGQTKSANLLQVAKITDNTTIAPKYSLPTLDKVIIEGDDETDVNSANIGDVITYNLKTKVPDMTGYSKYYFIVNDTLSPGLTYNNDLVITYGTGTGATTLTLDTDGAATAKSGDYYVNKGEYSSTDGTSVQVVFEDFYNKFKSIDVGTPITLSYTATLNNNAVTGEAGNPNTANLTYSNDPNANPDPGSGTDPDDTPDEPNPPSTPGGSDGSPVGNTPDDSVKTFTADVVIDKFDSVNDTLKLEGATFRISGTGLKYVMNEKGMYVKSATGTYYLLKDGSFTNEAPTGVASHDAAYASTTDKYEFTKKEDLTEEPVSVNTYGVTDKNGCLVFKGLDAGKYTITEIIAPDGYNLLPAPIDIEIKADLDNDEETCKWTFTPTDNFDGNVLKIANKKGTILPSTGGVGTKLFFIFGGVLAIGSGVYLVTRKRMSGIEQ